MEEQSQQNAFQRFMTKPSTIVGAIVAVIAIAVVPAMVSTKAEAESTINATSTFVQACNAGPVDKNGEAVVCRNLINGYIMGHFTTVKLAEMRAAKLGNMSVDDNQMFCPADEVTSTDMYRAVLAYAHHNPELINTVLSDKTVPEVSNVLAIATQALMKTYPCPEDSNV